MINRNSPRQGGDSGSDVDATGTGDSGAAGKEAGDGDGGGDGGEGDSSISKTCSGMSAKHNMNQSQASV